MWPSEFFHKAQTVGVAIIITVGALDRLDREITKRTSLSHWTIELSGASGGTSCQL